MPCCADCHASSNDTYCSTLQHDVRVPQLTNAGLCQLWLHYSVPTYADADADVDAGADPSAAADDSQRAALSQ
jgi:hypothetical protein